MTQTLRSIGLLSVALAFSAAAPASLSAAEVFYVDLAAYGPDVTSTVTSRINTNVQDQMTTLRLDYVSEVGAESAGGGTNASVSQAHMEYQRGIGLYVVNDYAGAATAFEAALGIFRTHASDVTDFNPIPDALFKLSESYFLSGNEEMARVMLQRALALRPEQVVNDSAGQAYGQFYASILETLGRNGAGSVTVTTTPSGLTVMFDGEDVGVSPVTVSDVGVGEHFVRVQNADGIGAGEAVSVVRGREAAVNLDLARAVSALTGGSGGEPRYLRSLRSEIERGTVNASLIPYLRELATRQGVQYVVVGVVVSRDGAYAALPFIYRASDGLFANVNPVSFDSSLSSVTVNSYQVATNIARAVQNFPADDLVTGAPIVIDTPVVETAAPVAAAAPSGPTMFEIEVPAAPVRPTPAPTPVAVAPVAPAAPAAPTYTPPAAPAAPAAPTYVPPAAPAAPTYTPPAAPTYAQPAAPTYGQPAAPTYGQPAAPTYGQPAAPTYGQPAAPTYGQPAAPTYGQPAAPTYGQPAAPTYGQPAAPTYGQPAAPTYGQPAAPTYGQPAAPTYGQPAAPTYGQPAAPTYGQPAAPTYGQPAAPTYGQPAAPTYGQPAAPTYGQPAAPTYGQAAAPTYGQDSSAYGTSSQWTPDTATPRERKPITRSPWLYVGSAVLVGGVVTAAVLASGGNEDTGGLRPVISW